MNSTLQCLLHIPELNYYFFNKFPNDQEKLKIINKSAETKGYLSEKYAGLLIQVSSNKGAISPDRFHNTIGALNPQFREYDANDSKDLLLFLFQAMHEELNYNGNQKLEVVPPCNQQIIQEAFNFFSKVNRKLNFSIFSFLFYGIFKSETICQECYCKFYNFQYFQIISFPLYNYQYKDKFNLYQGFKDYIQPEKMRGENQCYCQHCKKLTDSDVYTKIYSTPPYLIINLDYGKNKKYNPGKIIFGQSLDLTGFTEDNCVERIYELVAISSHIGSSGRSGHYIAYCKNLFEDTENDIWYEFNDSSVSKVRYASINAYSPYFLMFRKKGF